MIKNYQSFGKGRDAVLKENRRFSWLGSAFIALLMILGMQSYAQTMPYTFGQSSGTYASITGGTVHYTGSAITADGVITSVTIPSFVFNGTAYTNISISNNGFITFGTTAPLAANYNPVGATTAYGGAIAGFAQNLVASTVSGVSPEIRSATVGSEFVIQYQDIARTSNPGSDRINFQIRLNTANNTINVIYGNCATGATGSGAANAPVVGLRGASNTFFNTRMSYGTAPYSGWATNGGASDNGSTLSQGISTTSTAAGVNTMRFNNVTLPASGLTFTWSPLTGSYQTLPYTQNFETWQNLNAVADVPGNGIITFPATGNLSVRAQNETLANSLWGSAGGTIPALGASQGTKCARFHSYDSGSGNKGYMDFYLNFSTVGTKQLTFDLANTSSARIIRVFVSTDGGQTFGSAVATYNTTVSAWTTQTIAALSTSTSATAVVRFEFTADFANDFVIDNVAVTIPAPCATPTAQPTALSFSGVTTTAISGSFTAASPAPSKYLVVRSTSATAPTPVNGTVYAAASTALGTGTYVVQNTSAVSFSDSALTVGTQYYYYIYSYNDSCTGAPFYNAVSPLSGSKATLCAAATTPASNSVTTSTANITWTGSGNYIVEYGATGFTPGTGATAGAGGTIASSTATSPFALNGLSANTTYQFYIRQVCPIEGYSANTTVASFTTLCNAVALPLANGFATTSIPSCWTVTQVTTSGTIPTVTFVNAGTNPTTSPLTTLGANMVRFGSFTSGTGGGQHRLVAAPLSTVGNTSVDVDFQWRNENNATYSAGAFLNEGVQVQYSLDGITYVNAGSFFPRHDGTLAASTAAWKAKTVTLPAAAAGVTKLYVGFLFTSQAGDNCFLDEVSIVETPSCVVPSAPAVGSVTAHTASVSFTSIGNSFVVEYGPTGFTPGTGATAGTNGTVVTGSASPIALSALAGSTGYDVYVRQNCTVAGSGYSANSTKVSFTTLVACVAPTTPASNTVTARTANITFTGAGSSYIVEYGPTGFTPGTGATAGTNGTVVTGSASPIALSGLTPVTGYDVYVRNNCTANSDGYSLNTTKISFTTLVACAAPTAPGSNSVAARTANITFTGSGSNYTVEYGPTGFTPGTGATAGTNGTVVTGAASPIALSGLTPSTAYDVYVRNNCTANSDGYSLNTTKISFTTLVACAAPTALTATAITASGVSMTFTGSGSAYAVEYGPVGFTPGTGATAGTNGTIVTGSASPIALSGLAASTTYDVYVRNNCTANSDGYSLNSTKTTFTTLCAPLTAAVNVETFASYLPTCWKEGKSGTELAGPTTVSDTASDWGSDDYLNVPANSLSAKYNIDGSSSIDWLLSPQYTLTSGYKLRYNVGATQWNATTAPTTAWEADDYVQVLVSTSSDYSNWTVLRTYNATNVPPVAGMLEDISLSAYDGQTVRFALRGVEGSSNGSADIDFFIDNFKVELPAPAVTLSAASSLICAGQNSSPVTITSPIANYDTYVWSPATGVSGTAAVGYIFNPTTTTTYTLTATQTSGNFLTTTVSHVVNATPAPTAIVIDTPTASICEGSIQKLEATGGVTGLTKTVSSGTINLAIPDNSVTGVQRALAVSGVPVGSTITKVEVTFNLTHAFLPDAEVTLTAPNGKVIALAADQGPTTTGSYNNVVITSDNSAPALLTTDAVITGTYKANAVTAGNLKGSFGSNLTTNFADLFTTINGNWTVGAYDDSNTDLGTLVSCSITITYLGQEITWSPSTGLYTDAAATIAYVSNAPAAVVYAKPQVTTAYTATSVWGTCQTTASAAITVNTNVTYYADTDNDTYGNAAVSVVSCTGAPAGYVSNNTDCDDTNINVYQSANLYADADGDGYTNGAQVPVCYGASIPAGYTATSLGSDCDDTNNAIHATFTFYVDADKDGFGTGNLVAVCAVDANTPPLGYALNNTDCNDADATKHQSYSFYADNDGDGRGFGALVPNICAVNGTTPPAGYSLNNTDCDDTQATVYPGAPEILYDGLDNNCNGQLDEGNQLTTTLLAGSCGTTLASIGSLIQIKTVSSAITGYRLRVTNGSTVQIVTKTVPHFTLTSLPSYDYATTYSVEVELQRNGIWLGYYGTACLVSSPAVLDEGGATAVAPSQCGITLEKINTLISTRSLPGATGYRFRVTDITNGIENGLVQTIDRNLQYFGLQMLAVYKYNATYRIEVAVKTTGDYSNYGSPCEISSPKVGLVNCDATIASGTELVKANSVNGATQYRFQITNLANQASTTIDRNTNYFTFNMIPGYAQGGLYLIRVAVFTANTWSELGDGCEITAPGTAPVAKSAIESEGLTASDFKATVAPNPFASEFTLSVTGAGTAAIELRVYDMIGKLVENRSVNVSELENVKVGSRYPAGVYNLIVTQGEHVKTLRVIKR